MSLKDRINEDLKTAMKTGEKLRTEAIRSIRASIIDSFSCGYRTLVVEDCVGDQAEGPHHDNLRDVGRRYADIMTLDSIISALQQLKKGV